MCSSLFRTPFRGTPKVSTLVDRDDVRGVSGLVGQGDPCSLVPGLHSATARPQHVHSSSTARLQHALPLSVGGSGSWHPSKLVIRSWCPDRQEGAACTLYHVNYSTSVLVIIRFLHRIAFPPSEGAILSTAICHRPPVLVFPRSGRLRIAFARRTASFARDRVTIRDSRCAQPASPLGHTCRFPGRLVRATSRHRAIATEI